MLTEVKKNQKNPWITGHVAGIYAINFGGLSLLWCWLPITKSSHTSILSGCNDCEFILGPADVRQTKREVSEMMGDGGLTWQLQVMMQRDTICFSTNPLKTLPQHGHLSQRADGSLIRNWVCLQLSIHCSAVDICWAAGHSCQWWHCWAITAGTISALSGDLSCSPDCLHLVVHLALRWSCALKQSPQTKPFLWSFSVMWFVKIVYRSLLPTHCCSYLKTYLDGILQSLLKFAWITLLIFYCSTWIKWQAEMLIRLKFPSAMQVLLMFQLAL